MTIEALRAAIGPLDDLRSRHESIHGPAPSSDAARDATSRIGRYPFDLAGLRLGTSLDHLEGWRSIIASRRRVDRTTRAAIRDLLDFGESATRCNRL